MTDEPHYEMERLPPDADAAPPLAPQSASVQIGMTRAAQEVQAAMVIAKRFPRDHNEAYARIMRACKRKTLAEAALYAYPRGGTTVTGPSIRMAEVLAREWGNIDTGIVELEQRGRESVMMAYAWDLETNTRNTKIFTVRHERHTKQGAYPLNDPRDIYEMTANQGARRQRACILGVIPGDIIEDAVAECEKTMAGNNAEPLSDRLRKAVAAFSEMGVSVELIEKRLGHRLDVTSEIELVGLRKIYASIRDNMAGVDQFFDVAPAGNGGPKAGVAAVLDKLAPKAEPTPVPPPADEPAPLTDAEKAELAEQAKAGVLFSPDDVQTKGGRRGHAQ